MASPQSLFADASDPRAPITPEPPRAATSTAAPKLLTERQAAATLSVSPRTLWQLRNDGHIPCIRIGRAVRYLEADLAEWINTQRCSL